MFQTSLHVECLRGTNTRVLLQALVWENIIVPKGFRTNFASIPACLHGFVDNDSSDIREASVVHDYLYSLQYFNRRLADDILKEAMRCLGAPWWKRCLVYRSVRLAGWMFKE